MADFSKKQKTKLFSKNTLFAALGIATLALSAWLLTVDVRFYKKEEQLSSSVSSEATQVQSLQSGNTDLQEKIANYNNPEYIEKVAREEENMQKPGEHVVAFIMPQVTVQSASKPNPWSWEYFQAKISSAWQTVKSIF